MTTVARLSRSPIRELCSAVWLNHDPARCWVAVYFAYYDASGMEKKPDEPLAVAGIVAREDKWLKLEREWLALLKTVPLERLHMTDFKQGVGPYAALRADPKRELKFLRTMVDIIVQRIDHCFVVRLIPADLQRVNRDYKIIEHFGGAYALTASSCCGLVDMWMDKVRPGCAVHHILEGGDKGRGHFLRLQETSNNPAQLKPAQDPKTGKWFVPFQVADAFVHEHWLDVKRRMANDPRNRRGLLLAMRRRLHVTPKMIDEEVLRAACEEHPEMFPRRTPR